MTAVTVPSIAEIVVEWKSKVQPGKELFYSLEKDGEKEAKAYALQHSLHTIWDHMDPKILKEGTVQQTQEYFEYASTAYAQVVTGKAYVLLDGNPAKNPKVWQEGTIWDTVEWPELEKRSGVEVYRVSPSTDPSEGVKIK